MWRRVGILLTDPEDGILHSHRRGNLKSHLPLFFYYFICDLFNDAPSRSNQIALGGEMFADSTHFITNTSCRSAVLGANNEQQNNGLRITGFWILSIVRYS
jgi:hypothetical protein